MAVLAGIWVGAGGMGVAARASPVEAYAKERALNAACSAARAALAKADPTPTTTEETAR